MLDKNQEISRENFVFSEYGTIREDRRKKLLALSGGGATGGSEAAIRLFGASAASDIPSPSSPVALRKYINSHGEVFYIGDVLLGENSNGDFLMSWYAPQAKEFMKCTTNSPGDVIEFRIFKPSKTENKIVDFVEERIAALAEKRVSKVKELVEAGYNEEEAQELAEVQINDALLDELMNARSPEMQSIVRTMQATQYRIIEAPLQLMLTIQGGPGTGKTAIALHRLAYLIYNNENLTPDDVLIVGPNNDFYSYIKQIIPTIGQVSVTYATPSELCSVDVKIDAALDSAQVSELKERSKMADLIKSAIDQRIRYPSATIKAGPFSLSPAQVAAFIEDAKKLSTYNQGRSRLRSLIENLFVSSRFQEQITPQQLESIVQSIWPRLTPAEFLRDLYSSKERLLNAATSEFSAFEIQSLHREGSEKISEQRWSASDLPVLDFAASLIGSDVRKYKHIMVDEAQDLTPMQRLSIGRRSVNGSMTLLGDLAQSSLANGVRKWSELSESIHSVITDSVADKLEQLDIAYRLPSGIVDYLNENKYLSKLEPDVPKLKAVRASENSFFVWPQRTYDSTDSQNLDFDSLKEWVFKVLAEIKLGENYGEHRSIALITSSSIEPHQKEELFAYSELSAIHTPLSSKGLEFDYVLVAHAEVITSNSDFGFHDLFIALTRATQRVDVLTETGHLPMPTGVLSEDEETFDVRAPSARESRAKSLREELQLQVCEEIVEIIRETVPRSNWGKLLLDIQNELNSD